MVTTLVDVNDIRFTQEHVYDTFNANDARAGGVVELIEAIISGSKTPTDLPLIRVAAKRGAYWCVDNRRLFVYKHCQLGRIPVEVHNWKDSREFELKYRNGLTVRPQTGNGVRVGVIQRTDTPFPRSPVAEPSLTTIRVPYSPQQQRKHDAAIAKLRRRRERKASAGVAAEQVASLAESQRQLGGLLLKAKRKSKKRARAETAASEEQEGGGAS
eukprot:CAMPEP_0171221646 /NCGR_PEP_ID=MMETSP0790-20130122/34863_1 /TAXON_ID=2925 /ORGANISM="Alexandrium catenella, Strain OF101" /LENGTH=213 /DNA_ID=CAMNT_0011687583 /DNA_START=68 /DNA_END=706 /DNA_ORIENTATION=-